MDIIKTKKRKGSQMIGNYLNNSVLTGYIMLNNQEYIKLLIMSKAPWKPNGVATALSAVSFTGHLGSIPSQGADNL